MQFGFISRWDAERLRLDFPYVMISITDPHSRPAKIEDPNCQAILRLQFWDLDQPMFGHDQLFTLEMAKKILRYAKKHQYDVQACIVHCEAGISRSCAVASSLAGYFKSPDEERRLRQRGCPNALVCRTMQQVMNNGRD